MTWKGFFEGIQSGAETLMFEPLDGIRSLELDSWWAANFMSWVFIVIGFAAFFYWMKQLSIFNSTGEEDRSQTSHSYLG